ncbi:MAG TPA: PEGA domain-containing protein [Kofleriaceae bacterium]|jgi:hypothetical protein|nr:PEGA domain-containing protein [Kofleriaceae bacterium]
MRAAHVLIAATLGIAIAPTIVRAQAGAVLVYGTAKAHERQVVTDAVTRTVRQASWTVANAPFTPQETSDIIACLALDRPWPCVALIATPRSIARVVVVQVDPGSGGSVVVIGQVLVQSTAVPSIERRFCDPCSDQALDESAQELTSVLLERTIARAGKTAIEIHTVPPGASITIDGTWTGTSDVTIQVPPGAHQIQIQRSGYRPYSQHVTTTEGQTTGLTATLTSSEPVIAEPHDTPSRLVPVLVGGIGAVALAAGTAYSLTRGPSHGPVEEPRFLYSGPGLVVATAGGVALGVGLYLWFRPQSRSTPIAASLPHGGIVGWATSF